MPHNRLISMLIGLGMLGACSDTDERKRAAQNDNGTDLSMNIDGGNGSASVAFRLPAVKLGNAEVDIDGVKLYPGTRVTGVDISGQEGASEGGLVVRFESDASPAAIRDYYLAAFKEKGLTASADGRGIAGRGNDGKPFRIDFNARGSGTRGEIHMGQSRG